MHPARPGALAGPHGGPTGADEQRLVAEGDATAAEADARMRRLPLPVGISGMLDSTRLAKATQKLGLKDALYYRAGGAAAAEGDPGERSSQEQTWRHRCPDGDFSAVGTGTQPGS